VLAVSPTSGESVPLYFGCYYNEPGHGFHHRNGMAATYKAPAPTPWGYGVESLAPERGQGQAALHHKAGWTALAVDDFTVDDRPGSKSVFCFPEVLGFDDALSAAREHFPSIVERIGRVVDSGGDAEDTSCDAGAHDDSHRGVGQ
jgi:hypothetical protein